MVQVCEGTSSKNDMLVRSLDQYKNMYIIVKREFEKVTSVRSAFLWLIFATDVLAERGSTLSGSGRCAKWPSRWRRRGRNGGGGGGSGSGGVEALQLVEGVEHPPLLIPTRKMVWRSSRKSDYA